MNKRRFIPYVILFIVLLIWLFLRNEFLDSLEAAALETFDAVSPLFLYQHLIYLVDGLLLGSFFMVGRRISVNRPVLFLFFIPAALAGLLFVLPVIYPSMSWLSSPSVFLFGMLNSQFVFHLIGISLLAALYSGKK